jgi:Glycosyltransferase
MAADTRPAETYIHKPMLEPIEWIFFATNAKPSSAQRAVAHRLSETNSVVIVREPLSLLRNRSRSFSFESRISRSDVEPNCTVFMPVHYPERIPLIGRAIKRFGERKLLDELETLLSPLGSRQRVVCYDSPQQFPLVGQLGESLSVYLAIDDRTVTVTGEAVRGEVEAEMKLLARVNHVICVSTPLRQTLRARSMNRKSLPIDVITNGYDERMFTPDIAFEEPAALRQIPKPRVLVSGHVSERIDWDGIREAVTLRPAWSWIFVGPADAHVHERVRSISVNGRSAAFLFPPIPYEEVPAWIAHSDVCAVPYRLNGFTRASSPLKAIEYLAAGAPVLSTRVPSIEPFGKYIAWVDEADGRSYASALDDISRQERIGRAATLRWETVKEENWAQKAYQFRQLINGALGSNAGCQI